MSETFTQDKELQLEHVQFVVLRRGVVNESTIAVVVADVPEEIAEETAFLQRLREVITVWMNETGDGRRAYRETGKDFNIGDFPSFANAVLFIRLMKADIFNLQVNVISSDNSGEWSFDDHLFDESRIDDSK